jgi:hypothetical protein
MIVPRTLLFASSHLGHAITRLRAARADFSAVSELFVAGDSATRLLARAAELGARGTRDNMVR